MARSFFMCSFPEVDVAVRRGRAECKTEALSQMTAVVSKELHKNVVWQGKRAPPPAEGGRVYLAKPPYFFFHTA
jgi:hypothetical protein